MEHESSQSIHITRRMGVLRVLLTYQILVAQVVSGEESTGIPLPPYNWIGRNVTVVQSDPQHKSHVDTFAPIVKASLPRLPLHSLGMPPQLLF